jgi:DNA-binding NarL/FixJ family response regulator
MEDSRDGTRTPQVACLVADDNPHMLEATQALLESERIEVLAVAQSGIEALEFLEARPPLVVVLDLRLPDLSGLEVARRVAEIARRKTAVIIHTSCAGPDLVPTALDAGASGVVLKGSSPTSLLDAISTVAAGRVYVDPALHLAKVADS